MRLPLPASLSISKKSHFDFSETASADVQAAIQVSKDNRRNSNPLRSIAELLLTSVGQDFTLSQICANPYKRTALLQVLKMRNNLKAYPFVLPLCFLCSLQDLVWMHDWTLVFFFFFTERCLFIWCFPNKDWSTGIASMCCDFSSVNIDTTMLDTFLELPRSGQASLSTFFFDNRNHCHCN